MSSEKQHDATPAAEEEMVDDHGTLIEDELDPVFMQMMAESEPQHTDPRAVISWLTRLRERRGCTQAMLAEMSGQTQSAISRQENGDDALLSIEEVNAYIRGLNMSCTLRIYDDSMPMDIQINRTLLELMRLCTRLHRLLTMFGGHDSVLDEIDTFLAGAISPMYLEALDAGELQEDSVYGVMHMELAPGA